MKIRVPAEGEGNTIQTGGYDRDNGHNAAKSVVDAIRAEAAQAGVNCSGNLAKLEKPELEFGDLTALSNGTKAPIEVIRNVTQNLFEMSQSRTFSDHLALYEIVMKCRYPGHQFFGNLVNLLIQRGLVKPDGTIAEDVKNIVLSSMKGDALGLRFQSPLFGAD